MVALLLSHVELHAPASRGEILAFYADALGGAACTAVAPDNVVVINIGSSQLWLHGVREEPDAEAASLLAEALGGATAAAPPPPRPLAAGHGPICVPRARTAAGEGQAMMGAAARRCGRAPRAGCAR